MGRVSGYTTRSGKRVRSYTRGSRRGVFGSRRSASGVFHVLRKRKTASAGGHSVGRGGATKHLRNSSGRVGNLKAGSVIKPSLRSGHKRADGKILKNTHQRKMTNLAVSQGAMTAHEARMMTHGQPLLRKKKRRRKKR